LIPHAFYALIDRRDAEHSTADVIRHRPTRERWRLFTTNLVIAETHALSLSRLGRVIAGRVLSEIEASDTSIVRVTAADERRGRAVLAQYQDKDFSLTDAISFAVMDRLGIRSAFAFDEDFAQYGFAVLQAD
jgi:predicted nucleic acid-binding protein